jgi:hypothetical protein
MKGGSYTLAKLGGTISKLLFATFHIIPYYPCCNERVSVTEMMGVDDESIDEMEASKTVEPEGDGPEGALYIFLLTFQSHRNLSHLRTPAQYP